MMMMMIHNTNRCGDKFNLSRVSQTQILSKIQSIPGQNLHWRVMKLVLLKYWHNVNRSKIQYVMKYMTEDSCLVTCDDVSPDEIPSISRDCSAFIPPTKVMAI
jgi:hypothetical protein